MIPFGLSPDDRALVVATHPDDETLGAGGTIARLAEAGVEVDVLAVTCDERDAEVRLDEFSSACDVLGVAGRKLLWPSQPHAGRLGTHTRELVNLIESGLHVSLDASQPRALLLPEKESFHQDHQVVHHAAVAAARLRNTGAPAPAVVLGICGPEDVAWRTSPRRCPVIVETTDHWPAKNKALGCYTSQERDDTHPRHPANVKAQDVSAGTAVGVATAEMFTCYRMAF